MAHQQHSLVQERSSTTTLEALKATMIAGNVQQPNFWRSTIPQSTIGPTVLPIHIGIEFLLLANLIAAAADKTASIFKQAGAVQPLRQTPLK
jgi:hypothetical protein